MMAFKVSSISGQAEYDAHLLEVVYSKLKLRQLNGKINGQIGMSDGMSQSMLGGGLSVLGGGSGGGTSSSSLEPDTSDTAGSRLGTRVIRSSWRAPCNITYLRYHPSHHTTLSTSMIA